MEAGRVMPWEWRFDDDAVTWSKGDWNIFEPGGSKPTSFSDWISRLHPADRDHAATTIRRSVEAAEHYADHYRLLRADGSVRHVRVAGDVERGGRGKALVMRGILIDITAPGACDDLLDSGRQAFLLKLNDALRTLTEPTEVVYEACRQLAEQLKLDRAYFVEIDELAGITRVTRDIVRDGAITLAGEHHIADFSWSVAGLRFGECLVVDNTQASKHVPDAARAACAGYGIIAYVGAPLIKAGLLIGALCVTDRQPRHWSDDDVQLVRHVGERIWEAVERARAETALRESETRYRALVEASSDVVYHMSADWQEMHQLFGRSFIADTLQPSRTWLQTYIPPEEQSLVMEAINDAICMKRTFELEHRVLRADGTLGWTLSRAIPILDSAGEIVEWFGMASDVTARKQAGEALSEKNHELEARIAERTREVEQQMRLREETQAALARSQRMEALGQLSGGIAHDFNNLLTIISGNLELAEIGITDPRASRAVRRAIDAINMGATLNRRLLSFARRRQLAPERISMNDLIQEMIHIIRQMLGDTIVLKTKLSDDLWPTRADPGEIDSAIINIAVNARDAMPDGGQLLIATNNLNLAPGEAEDAGVQPGGYVSLTIKDSGNGMTPEVLRRAVEPFFTTKEAGKGTGLGLSSVYGFAQQSGGFLNITSEVGVGTTIQLCLPRTLESETVSSPTSPERVVPMGDGELILVVEDDEEVRRVTLGRLELLGYTVLEASDGSEAVEFLKTEDAIELVFTDVVMPGVMSGYDVAAWVDAHRPDVKVLLTSGYREDVAVKPRKPELRVLSKPYSRSALARAVRHLLDA